MKINNSDSVELVYNVLNDQFNKLSIADKHRSGMRDVGNFANMKRRLTEENVNNTEGHKQKKLKDSNFKESEKVDSKLTKNGDVTKFGKELQSIKVNESKSTTGTKQIERAHSYQSANFFIDSVREVFSIDYENPSLRINGFADIEYFRNKDIKYKVSKKTIQGDHYYNFMKTIKENEWRYVFSSLTTRFTSKLLPPTIMIRCIFYFILTTNDADLLEEAITAISSHWHIHHPKLGQTKGYYQRLFLETENLKEYPLSIGGKLFNDIVGHFLSSLRGENTFKLINMNETVGIIDSMDEDNDSMKEDVSDDAEDSSDDGVEYTTEELEPDEQLQRIRIAFRLLLDLLETDFMVFLVKYKDDPKKSIHYKLRKPLIARLVDLPDLETVLKALYSSNNEECIKEIIRYINLLAEVSRVQGLEHDVKEDGVVRLKYPYFGNECIEFAKKLGHTIKSSESSFKGKVSLLARFQPWLQMYIFNQWLTERTRIVGEPSITFVVKLLMLCLKEIPTTADTDCRPESSSCFDSDCKKLLSKYHLKPSTIHRRNPKGETKLNELCRLKKTNVVRALLSLGVVDVNTVCNAGWSALHEASSTGNIDIVRMLLSYKPNVPNLKPVNVYATNPEGITALFEAAVIGNLEICKLLVEKGGAKLIEMETKDGLKPINYTKSDKVIKYFTQVLLENQSMDFLKKQVFLNLDMIDFILIRELSFAYINVYCLDEILKRHNHKLGRTRSCNKNTFSTTFTDRTNLKPDFKSISDNIKAYHELKFVLKSIIDQQNQTGFHRPLQDWLNCLYCTERNTF